MIRRDFIEVAASRELRRFPESLDPTAPRDPFVMFGLGDARLYFGQKILKRIRPFQIQIHLARADSKDMAMRIGQARHDRRSVKIDHAGVRAGIFFCVAVWADKNNTLILYGDGLSPRLSLV